MGFEGCCVVGLRLGQVAHGPSQTPTPNLSLPSPHLTSLTPRPSPPGASLGDPTITPASLVYMRQLNEAESNLLLTCASDGAVRVWRSYLHSGNQRLAAAWQAVPMRQPAAPVPWSASYALADATRQYWLYAAGGSHPDVLQRWDLHSEMCAQQVGCWGRWVGRVGGVGVGGVGSR